MTRPILIIEDDADISESLKYNFEREGLPAVKVVLQALGDVSVIFDNQN